MVQATGDIGTQWIRDLCNGTLTLLVGRPVKTEWWDAAVVI